MMSGFVRFHEALEPLMDDLNKVTPHPENANNGDVEAIAASILHNGYVDPIVAEKATGRIVAGNHRYHALLSLGADQAPIIWVEMDDLAGKRYMLADNETARMAKTDHAQLLMLLNEQVECAGGDMNILIGTGYTENYMNVLTELVKMENEPTSDFAQWPTITMQVPPHVKKAFMAMTKECDEDRDRMELLLRLAGWDGAK